MGTRKSYTEFRVRRGFLNVETMGSPGELYELCDNSSYAEFTVILGIILSRWSSVMSLAVSVVCYGLHVNC